MDFNSNLSINTKRLILKLVNKKYIDEINTNFTKEVTKYMPFNPTGNREDIEDFVESSFKNLKEKTEIIFVALDLDENFLGCCGIHDIKNESVEVGLWLKENNQNQGFGTEILGNLLSFIEQNFRISYIIYPVDKENIRSRRISEKFGFIEFKTYTKQKDNSKNLNIIEYRKQC